jgi:FixJ family two-component response regulator
MPTSEWQSIAMVSGYDDVRIAVELIRLGAVIRLEKQFRLNELLATSAWR